MPTTEPWWTCNHCGSPIYRVGKGKKPADLWQRHRAVCHPLAGGSIKQWDQQELRLARRANDAQVDE